MKAKERERRWESQYVLEKDTHRHTRRDGESASPGGPHSGQSSNRFWFRKPQLSKTRDFSDGAEGDYKILDPKQFLTV